MEYAKATPEDLLIRIHVIEPRAGSGRIDVVTHDLVPEYLVVGIRCPSAANAEGKPVDEMSVIELDHEYYGERRLWCEGSAAVTLY